MQTTVNLPYSLYLKSEALAAARGVTVEEFIIQAVKKEVQGDVGSGTSCSYGDREIDLPVIRSRRPGTLACQISILMTCFPDVNLSIAWPRNDTHFIVAARHWFSNLPKRKAHVLPPYSVKLSAAADPVRPVV